MGRMVKQVVFILAVVVSTTLSLPARAGFVAGYTGNSQTLYTALNPSIPNPTSDGLINFAVWDNSAGGNWIADFATSFGVSAASMNIALGATGREAYVYLYQMVNTNPDPSAESNLHLLQIETGTSFNGAGYLFSGTNSVGFSEAAGTTGPTTDPAIGTATTDTLPGNQVPGSSTGVLNPTPFASVANGKTPTGVTYLVGDHEYQFEFADLSGLGIPGLTDHSLAPDGYSTIVFLTSDVPPTYLKGTVHNGVFSQGDVPSNTPEPVSIVSVFGALVTGMVAWGIKCSGKIGVGKAA